MARENDILSSDIERQRVDYEGRLANKAQEYDNLKRAYDEAAYESENLRRTVQ